MNFYYLKSLYVFTLALMVVTGSACQSQALTSSVKTDSRTSLEIKSEVNAQESLKDVKHLSVKEENIQVEEQNFQSVTEAVEKIKASYDEIKGLFEFNKFEEASVKAYQMIGYVQFIPENIGNVNDKELAEVQALAKELNSHIIEVAEFSRQEDVNSAQFHLKHVFWKAFAALRSRVIKQTLKDEKATALQGR